MITTYSFDAYVFGLILIIPLSLLSGILFLIDRSNKSDFVKITAGGISFSQDGETGFVPWENITEIRCSWKAGNVIKAGDVYIKISHDIEPAEVPLPSFFKRFFFNYQYKNELAEQIRLLAPNATYRSGY